MKNEIIEVNGRYDIGYWNDSVELPKGKTHKDIKDIWIRWDEGEITFNDDTTLEFDIDLDREIIDDLKRPDNIIVFKGFKKVGEF